MSYTSMIQMLHDYRAAVEESAAMPESAAYAVHVGVIERKLNEFVLAYGEAAFACRRLVNTPFPRSGGEELSRVYNRANMALERIERMKGS